MEQNDLEKKAIALRNALDKKLIDLQDEIAHLEKEKAYTENGLEDLELFFAGDEDLQTDEIWSYLYGDDKYHMRDLLPRRST